MRRILSCGAWLAVTAVLPAAMAQVGMQEGEWLNYGGDKGHTQYSTLDQINKENVKDLRVVWEWISPDGELTRQNPRLMPFIYEATPIVVDGVMYTSTSLSQVAAIDPRSGETLWTFDTKSWEAGRPTNLGFVHRGVSYWRDGTDERVFIGTGDSKLWSLDAKTGQPAPDFFDGSPINLAETLRRDHNPRLYAVTSPPLVIGDAVIVGSSIFDGPTRKEMPPGDVRAYDAKTGQLLWTFHNPPMKGEPGYETWKNGSAEYTGNANVWTNMAADPELGHVYLPFGTPTNDWYGGHRKGQNLFAETLVCLDAETGKRVWHFQTTHHGLWDYDLPAAPTLMDITVDGRDIKALAQVTKQGFVFVLDRETGEPVWPIEERPVPKSTAEGEETWPTQPFPTKPAPYEPQGMSPDMLIDLTPELKEQALEILSKYNYGPLYTPPMEGKLTIYNPGWGGGANWMGAAFDPETQMLYVPSMTGPIGVDLIRPDPARSNFTYIGRNQPVPGPQGLPLLKPPFGRVTAIDMTTGEHKWVVPHGDGPRDHPALKDLDLPRLGNPSRGHPLLTKTLLFMAEAAIGRGTGGSGADLNFRAYDKATGELIAELELPGNLSATPMTYMIDGKQYITVAAGGLRDPSKLITLSLP